jgi:hypothetical protein
MTGRTKSALLAIIIASLYALILRCLFGVSRWNEIFEVMSFTFLFLLPTIIGALVVYFSKLESAKSVYYQILMPWFPIFIFLVVTIALEIEGWACWIMLLPVFLLAASLGGIIGGYMKTRKAKNDKLNISILILLPFFVSPLEQFIGSVEMEYEAITYIDIAASAEDIWPNVTAVKEIPQELDSGHLNNFLGFPRPIKAELNYNGIGAYRKAVFTNGLVFHETVTDYTDNRRMNFTIKAFPHEIPSTTLDEHVVIGGKYFDVLNGEYFIEPLNNGMNRLHLKSKFKMKTTFNFYASWWAKWIMSDIQNNILKVQKLRSEKL